MTTHMAFTTRSFLLRLALTLFVILAFTLLSRAGGPKYVAGTNYFDATTAGQPLVWPGGAVTYYTDQGNLSPILPNAAANVFVANAFGIWTSIPTAAISATSGGQLAEDVNGSNVIVNSDGTISMPLDIQSSATATPVGIVYDYDGSVTSDLIGAGAGGSSQCFSNAVFGGTDNFGTFASYQHALIVINGQCAQQSSQLNDVEHRLVRVIGSVLGLGWSQANLNVQTNNPPATSDDYAGFPLMHYSDPKNCIPITLCYSNPYTPAMDDIAAISRLYPVTPQNQATFSGKQVFASTTARIHGTVWFTDSSGGLVQPMQGVNVVARWIDPSTNQPSRRYVATSVSGFLYCGNDGNPITGEDDALGNPFSDWGSDNSSLEGFFDLGGLEFPNGGSAQYQLTVEPVDPALSTGVGPYAPWQVAPSGLMQPITVTLSPGQDVQQDILMTGSAQAISGPPSTWTSPAQIPAGGDWNGSIGTYGATPYYMLAAQAGRTLSIAVTALNESGVATESKLQPVIGMWSASDPEGTAPPAFTPISFNTTVAALTRLDVQIATSTNFLIGIADLRGDGRPDYSYHAHILYADTASPSRLSVAGGPVTLQGVGFTSGLTVTFGNTTATQLLNSAGQMIVMAPAMSDGTQNITVADPVTGSSSVISSAVTYGAASSDNIILLSTVIPPTPVGAPSASPMRIQVVAADGVTPVSGATVGWSATGGQQLSICNGLSSCTSTTDQSGALSTWLTPTAVGTSVTTATLAPGVYSSTKSVSTNLTATQTSSDIGLVAPLMWLAQGATVSMPLTARVLSNGVPQTNVKVNYTILSGSGTLSAASAQTSSTGYATVNLSVTQISAPAQVSACVAPANAPCQPFYVKTVPVANLKLVPVSGVGQVSTGQGFQPLVLRVTDSATPPNSVIGAAVVLLSTVFRPGGSTGTGGGETNTGNSGMPVILNVSQSTVVSDINGLVSTVPSTSGFGAPLEINIAASAGTSASVSETFAALPAPLIKNSFSTSNPPQGRKPPLRIVGLRIGDE